MYTELKLAIFNLTESINAIATALFNKANQQKEELAQAARNLEITNSEIQEVVGILDELSAITKINGSLSAASTNIKELIDDVVVFESNVEAFDGYCDICGAEITVSDEATVTEEMGLICAECAKAKAENENEN
jgi:hypothetical protein